MTPQYCHDDRNLRRFSLKRAIGHTAVYASLILFGFLQLDAALNYSNSYCLYSGPLMLTVGVFGVFNGLRLVQRNGR